MAQVGIDLGTCNSVVATMEGGRVVVVDNKEGKNTTPSVVFFNSNSLDDAAVGQPALFSANNNPLRACRYIKKRMGFDYKFKIDDKEYTPEEISAAILKKLIRDAEEFLGETITDVVITVPAWFDIPAREATKKAAEMLGVTVRATFPEPIAAAIDYAQAKAEQLVGKTLLVYDLGGGTFDVTLIGVDRQLENSSLGFRVLGKDGSIDLGGYNWDKALHDYVAEEFAKVHGKSPADDPISSDLLMTRCQEAKESLSNLDPSVPYDISCRHEGLELKVSVTRTQFEQITESLLNASMDKVNQLMNKVFSGGSPWDRIDLILLAGGSTKMPIVSDTLEKLAGKKPVTNRGVDLNVGRGAAYVMFSPDAWINKEGLDEPAPAVEGEAAAPGTPRTSLRDALKKHGPTKALGQSIDTVQESIGVAAIDKLADNRTINCVIIPGGSPCGTEHLEIFGLYEDGQTGADIEIYAGDDTDLSRVRLLGTARITGLPTTAKENEEVHVKLKIDGNGLIVGTATHVATGIQTAIRVDMKQKRIETGEYSAVG